MTGYEQFVAAGDTGNKNDIPDWITDHATWLPVVTWPADRTPRRSREP